MTDDVQPRRRSRRVLLWALGAVVLLLAGLLVPPYISMSRYRKSITELMARSLGRPVRLSSVELRLLPRPGFVLTDLSVDEDAAYGAEPVLHADSVKASIRLLSLWRGKLEIDSISVDQASVNLVRAGDGVWNLDPLFRTAAAHVQSSDAPEQKARRAHLPYLQATNSRFNFKNGKEKLPYSLVNADVSFWQDDSGEWKLRMRGQPARTDVTLDLADTGIVRVEASLHPAPQLRQMPILIDAQWREAQLGQLSRLLFGSDPGWRGDLTGQLHLEGTPDSAKVATRLSASGVHRAEFAPADPLDFDANCSFQYHYSQRTVEKLACDSPVGDGHVHLEGELPGNAQPRLTVSLDRISTQVGLDVLRTVRSNVANDLEAHGSITGKLIYEPARAALPAAPAEKKTRGPKKPPAAEPVPLSGSLAVKGLSLSGGPLDQPLRFPDFTLEPVTGQAPQPLALQADVEVPAGGAAPMKAAVRVSRMRYAVELAGEASFKRLLQFSKLAGHGPSFGLDQLSGDAPELNMAAEGNWIPENSFGGMIVAPATAAPASANAEASSVMAPPRPASGALQGSVTMRKASWRSPGLANPVALEGATLELEPSDARWSGDFTYGPLKGHAQLVVLDCRRVQPCVPSLTLHFDELDSGVFQTALLGASDKKTLLSSLIGQFTSNAPPAWPELTAHLSADTLILGPLHLHAAEIDAEIHPQAADIRNLSAEVFGARLALSGTAANGQRPSYSLAGSAANADAKQLCQFFSLQCAGGTLDLTGKVDLSGFAARDLASSAKGSMHFSWSQGALKAASFVKGDAPVEIPKALAHFTQWTADGSMAGSVLTMDNSVVEQGRRKDTVPFTITFGEPPHVAFASPAAPAKTAARAAAP